MTGLSVVQRDKNFIRKWFGGNHGSHWTVAGIVAVTVFGSYFIYRMSATQQTSAPAPVETPALLPPVK